MILAVVATLVAGLAALAPARCPPAWRRPLGWALVTASLAGELAVAGPIGLVMWLGLVPVTAGAILLHRAYRPRPGLATAMGVSMVVAILWLNQW